MTPCTGCSYDSGVVSWNEDELDFSLLRRLEKVVNLFGQAMAVRDQENSLTFRDIWKISHHTAGKLLSHAGFIPHTPVGILAGPTFCRISGMLAAVIAGCPFVPLDFATPPERLRQIIQNCGLRVVLSDSGLLPLSLKIAGQEATVLILQENMTEDTDRVFFPGTFQNPLAIVYTSGSEGAPKGVIHSHRSILHEAKSSVQTLELTPGDRMIQVSAMGSVANLSQTFTALLNGLVSMPFSLRNSSLNTLGRWIQEQQVTVWSSAPTIFRNLCQHFPCGAFPSLRRVRLGGERVGLMDLKLCKDYCAKDVIAQIAYGTTETGIIATRNYPLSDGLPVNQDEISIGKAAGKKQLFLLDSEMRQVNRGETGEIAVSGEGLALGYQGDDLLTASRFSVDDIFGSGKTRFYLTGDLGRMDESDYFHFQGRKDNQMNLNGFRVEPGEIEAAILTWPGVVKCAVVLSHNQGEERLTAFLEGNQENINNSAGLRTFLLEKLPGYMVPAHFIQLDGFPENANGKVDLKALSRWSYQKNEFHKPECPADTQTSNMLGIWRDILKQDSLTVTDNFFNSGGDSLQMLQLLERIRKELNQEIEVSEFLKMPTIVALSEWLHGKDDSVRMGIEPGYLTWLQLLNQQKAMIRNWKGIRRTPDTLMAGHNVAGQNRPLFWCFQGYEEMKALSGALGSEQPLYGMRSGHLIIKSDSPFVSDFATVYAEEISRIATSTGLILGGNCQGAYMAMQVAQQLIKKGFSIDRFFIMEADIPLPVNYPVSLIFGRESSMNPYLDGKNPEEIWNSRFSSYTVDICPGAHGHFFDTGNREELALLIHKRIQQTP